MVAHIVGKEMSQEKTNIVKLDKEDDADRVIRDGCWYVSAGGGTHVSYRDWFDASLRNRYLGWRLVLQTKERK